MCAAVRIWLVALCVGWLSAQARPTFGRVLDGDGEPVAGAVVTLVGGLPHLSIEFQDVDVVKVAADDRGRVVPRLQPGLCYSAWAVGPESDGRVARSPVRGYFAAGGMFDLVLGEPTPVARTRVDGGDAWAAQGPLTIVAMTSVPGTEHELLPDDDGRLALPGPPFDTLEVRTADGAPLWQAALAGDVAPVLELPPPCAVRVRVVDEDGEPLAGVPIRHRVGHLPSWRHDGLRSGGRERERVVGVTDEDGRCEVVAPCAADTLRTARDNLLLFAAPPGRPAVAGGRWNGAFYVSDRKVARLEDDVLEFACAAPEPLRGRVPAAPAGTVAHLAAICKLYLQRNSYVHDQRVFTAEVDGDGMFSFDDVPAELHSCRLSFVPPAGSDWRPPVFAPEASRTLPAELAVRESGPAPFSFGKVTVQVLDSNGGPARGAIALVSASDRVGVLMRDSLLRVALDERGAAELRLVTGRWVVVVVTDRGFGGEELTVGETDVDATIALQPLGRAEVRLTDADGEPVAAARVRSRGSSTRGTNDALRSILQGLQKTTRHRWVGLRTDADGRVTIPFLPVEGVQQRVDLRWDGARSDEFALQAGGPIEVREVVPSADGERRIRRNR